MTFAEVLVQLKQKKIVRRPKWAPGFGMCLYRGELWYTIDKALHCPCHVVDEKNILADDWEVQL